MCAWRAEGLPKSFRIPLVIWGVYSVIRLATLDYYGAVEWIGSPLNATLMILTIAISFMHMSSGVRVIIEDYVYGHLTKAGALLLNLFICGLAGALAIMSILKVALGGA